MPLPIQISTFSKIRREVLFRKHDVGSTEGGLLEGEISLSFSATFTMLQWRIRASYWSEVTCSMQKITPVEGCISLTS